MATGDDLYLHEELMLLALKDKEGTIFSGTMYHFAIGGAILADLMLRGRVEISRDGRRKMVELLSSTPFGEPLIDDCLARIQNARRHAAVETWVSRFASIKNLKHRVAQRLCQRGILRADEDKVVFIFTRRIYPEVDPGPERALIERLQEAIFNEAAEVEPRTVVLVSLAYHTYLLRTIFDKKDLERQEQRIASITRGEVLGEAAKEVVQATEAAVLVATTMPAVMIATSQ